MTKSASKMIKPPAQTPFSSRIADFKTGDLLHVNNIQGRRLRNVFRVNVKNVDTLGQLKKIISARNGLSVVAVYYRGVYLEDERKLAPLLPGMIKMGPPRFSVRTRLHTEPKPGGISLFVKGLKGSTFQVRLPSLTTVADLRAAIRDYEGYCSEQDFQITFAGKNLREEDWALTTYNLVPGSLVDVVGRLLGGDANHAPARRQRFVDMENISSLKTMKMFPIVTESSESQLKTKDWKIYEDGLIVRGKCENAHCEAYDRKVCCNKGFTVFNIAEDVQCPMCNGNFKATACGFTGCRWMFEGRKTGIPSVDVMSKWHVTGEDEYQYFDEEGGRNTTDWSNLVITTMKLESNNSVDRGNVVNPDCSKCALCFGTTTVLTSSANTPNVAPCGHAVHSDCAMVLWREGYTTCPTCRDPMAALSINSNTPAKSGAGIP